MKPFQNIMKCKCGKEIHPVRIALELTNCVGCAEAEQRDDKGVRRHRGVHLDDGTLAIMSKRQHDAINRAVKFDDSTKPKPE